MTSAARSDAVTGKVMFSRVPVLESKKLQLCIRYMHSVLGYEFKFKHKVAVLL